MGVVRGKNSGMTMRCRKMIFMMIEIESLIGFRYHSTNVICNKHINNDYRTKGTVASNRTDELRLSWHHGLAGRTTSELVRLY